MTTFGRFPAALLTSGPVARLLELASRSDETSLDDEIQRYVRLVEGDWIAHLNCPPLVAAALLEMLATSLESGTGPERLPAECLETLRRACGGDAQPAACLRTLAGKTRSAARTPTVDYGELPMSSREFHAIFPYLFGLDVILTDEADGDFSAVVRTAITNEHPCCQPLAAAYATEAQRALVLFPGPAAMSEWLVWASRDRLQEIIDIVNDHIRREHS